MASRFWVGGNGTWDTVTTTHWSASSGGAGGASVPTSSDSVFLDANSGVGSVTVNPGGDCLDLTTTGFTGNLGGSNIHVNGNLVVGATNVAMAAVISMAGTSKTITLNGKTIGLIEIDGSTTLSDTFACTDLIVAGTLNCNNKNVTSNTVLVTGPTASYTMGTGTHTISTSFEVDDVGATISAGSAFLVINNTGVTFTGAGKTYNSLVVNAGCDLAIADSNSFNTYAPAAGSMVTHAVGITITVTTLTLTGSAGNTITLKSSSGGSAWNLSKSSGTVSATYLVLSDSHASGGATFNATSTIDGGGNTGWNITPPAGNGGAFFAFF